MQFTAGSRLDFTWSRHAPDTVAVYAEYDTESIYTQYSLQNGVIVNSGKIYYENACCVFVNQKG